MDNTASGSFSINRPSFGTSDFLESNNLVVKFAFLLLVLIMFVVILRLGISMLGYFMSPSLSPELINGMIDANYQNMDIPQDPNMSNSITIYRSVNEKEGIEFTWSVWLFINDISNNGMYKHVFSKGNNAFDASGIIQPNNAPGLYISPNTNNLIVKMNTYNSIDEEIEVPGIPMNKWFNVIIRCLNTRLDVYINGTITRSITLSGVPKQNYGDVYVAQHGGFNGYISKLAYFNHALSLSEIQKNINSGPSTKMIGLNGLTSNSIVNNYLSLRWFFNSAV